MARANRFRALGPDLPSAVEYIEALPAALASHADCRASRRLVETLRRDGSLDRVADALSSLPHIAAETPSEWVPEVEYVAVLLAILDRAFDRDRERFLTWTTQKTAQRMARLDVPSLRGDSAERFMADVPRLWRSHHQGTRMRVARYTDGEADVVLEHPTSLFPPLILEYFARSLALALVRVDAAQPRVSVETKRDHGGAETTMFARWNAV
jgi:hypothetical protein